MNQKIPIQLNYSRLNPRGFPSLFKQWTVSPMSSNKTWYTNDIVRFNFQNMGDGVFDPYRSYLQITVSVDSNELPVGLLQIDNSAQSFIDQLVIYSESRQVQRITSYSVLLSYLNDIGISQIISQGRQTQGLGYGSFDTMPFNQSCGQALMSMRRQNNSSDYSATYSTNNIFPTIGNAYPQTVQYFNMNSLFNCSKSAKGHVTNSNQVATGSDYNGGNTYYDKTGIEASLNYTGYVNNIRAQYNANFIANKYVESTQSIPCYELCLDQSVSKGQYPFKYQPNVPYKTNTRSSLTQTLYYDQYHQQNSHTVNCANFGFSSLYSPFFTRGTFQPFISPTTPQCMIKNGIIQKTKSPIYRKKFKIPIASCIMGILINPQQFLLVPVQSINSVLMQITLDPYAMFTSGYNDVSEFDDVGMGMQQKRCYSIDRIQYKLHTYHFINQEVKNYIKTSLYREILFNSTTWSLGNKYQIPGNSPVNNSYIVSNTTTHLNQIVALFIANDYQIYSFCRKHFRLSNNVKRFWSKIGIDYWPPQPYKGNGGNPQSNDYDDDNSIFVENIYWSNQYMFNNSTPLPRINVYNFSINDRPYNVQNKNTFYDPQLYKNQNYAFTSTSVNADTALGMAWIHQNRCIGKAAYTINYTPFSEQQAMLQGIDISQINNFQLLFETDEEYQFPRDQTLYIFCKSSVIVSLKNTGINVYGR